MAALTEAEILVLIAAVDAAISALVTRKVKRYSIGERSFEFYDIPSLFALRKGYQETIESIPCEEATVFDDPDI